MEEPLGATEPRHGRPLLTVEEQIARLKSKGIAFDLCGEAEAATILAKQNNYLRITSYRQLYDRQTEGANVGAYINLDFGAFVNFYLFCANRWEDNAMLQEHYVLKSVKALRNATAHNHCVVDGFTKALTGTAYDTPQVITESLNAAGMPRTKTRRAKLGNVRIAQMAAAVCCLNALRDSEHALARHANHLADLRAAYEARVERYRLNSSLVSFFDFLFNLVGIWVPQRR